MARRKSVSGGTSSLVGEVTVVRMNCPCGWCITNQCEECLPELLFEKKLYMCGCKKCCNGHTPSVGVESVEPKTSEGEEPDDEESILDGDVSDEDAS